MAPPISASASALSLASVAAPRLLGLSLATGASFFGVGVGLPLFLAAFQDEAGAHSTTGPYFLVTFVCMLFVPAFWSLVALPLYRGELQAERAYVRTSRGRLKLIAFGLLNSSAGLLRVYSGSTTRVPGALQPILQQATLLFTVLGSRLFLKKSYATGQLFAVGLVTLGIGISLSPSVWELSHAPNGTGANGTYPNGTEAAGGAPLGALGLGAIPIAPAETMAKELSWASVLVLSCAPMAAMALVQESVFDDVPSFDVRYLLAYTSVVQIVWVAACWWTDVIPGFGTSSGVADFVANFEAGLGCFFAPAASANPSRCVFAAPIGAAYIVSLCASLYYGGKIVMLASANLQALIIALASAVCIYFWIAFTSVARWSGGNVYSQADVLATSLALLPLTAGIVMFRAHEPQAQRLKALHAEQLVVRGEAGEIQGVFPGRPGAMHAPLLASPSFDSLHRISEA